MPTFRYLLSNIFRVNIYNVEMAKKSITVTKLGSDRIGQSKVTRVRDA